MKMFATILCSYVLSGCVLDFGSVGPQGGIGGEGGSGGSPSVGGSGGAGATNAGGSGGNGGSPSVGGSGGEGGGGAPPTGPCGEIPQQGLWVCWVYGKQSVQSDQFVGLTGGEADPTQGQVIDPFSDDNVFLDPWVVSPNMGEEFILYDLGEPGTDWDVQFRAGLYAAPGEASIDSTWDCGSEECFGDVTIYHNGEVIGSLSNGIPEGVISTVEYFKGGTLNVKLDPPPPM